MSGSLLTPHNLKYFGDANSTYEPWAVLGAAMEDTLLHYARDRKWRNVIMPRCAGQIYDNLT